MLVRQFQKYFRLRSMQLGCFIALSLALAAAAPAKAQEFGKFSALYQFTGGADGAQAYGGVVKDDNGTLYGETSLGGTASCTSKVGGSTLGCGTIYSFSRRNGFKVLATFTGPNGAHGQSTLTLAGSTLYGLTYAGGQYDKGVLFSINTDGTNFRLLHDFNGIDGEYLGTTLVIDRNGVIYGSSQFGGPSANGTLFSLKPDGTFSVLHNFAGGNDGSNPFTLLLSNAGDLVGSTALGGGVSKFCPSGCGSIFQYQTQTSQYSIPYSYTQGGGAGGVIGAITPGPGVYGASAYFVYTISSSGGYQVQGSFDTLQVGSVTSSPYLLADGSFMGGNGAGPNQGAGSVYMTLGNGNIMSQLFSGGAGGIPFGRPILLPGDRLLGTTTAFGKCKYCGAIWLFTPNAP